MALGTLLKNILGLSKYHIKNITNPTKFWDKIEALYGTIDEHMAYTIEDNIIKLDPRNLDTIKYYLTQIDMYKAQIKDCGEPIKDGNLIKHVMTHLPLEYGTFVSSYNTHNLTMGSAFTKPLFESF